MNLSSEATDGFSPFKSPERFEYSFSKAFIALALLKCALGLTAYLAGLTRPGFFPKSILVIEIITFCVVGIFLVAGSKKDERALFLAGAYTCGAASFATSLLPANTLWEALWHVHPDAFVPLFLWWFARDFPATLWLKRGRMLMSYSIGFALAAGTLLFSVNLVSAVMVAIKPVIELPAVLRVFAIQAGASLYWTILYAIAVPALPFMIFRSTRAAPAERRRAILFVSSVVAGVAPLMLIILLEGMFPPFLRFMNQPHVRYWSGFIVYPSLWSVPLTTAYAILRHRVLDVRIIIRKALRYALARYTVIVAAATPLVALFLYVYRHRNETIMELMTGRQAAMLLGVSVVGWTTLKTRQAILTTIDKHFFREQYDAGVILMKVAQHIQTVTHDHELGEILTSYIDRAFHPESVYVMIFDEAAGQFRCTEKAMRGLDSTAELVRVLVREGRPITIDYSAGVSLSLPIDEQEWLAEGACRIVVPLIGSRHSLVGFIGIGEKKSELPFTPEDQVLLDGMGRAGASALEGRSTRKQPVAAVEEEENSYARICHKCGRVYPTSSTECSTCRGDLREAQIPFVLLGKFRFEQLLGSGGMGIVYRGLDLTLGRSVAIKTLPRMSPDSALRLRLEARAIASVTHPNLAMIFGAETWRGQPMLVFEYLPGGSLGERIGSKRLDLHEMLHLGIALAGAIDAVHATGMLHRDVKPNNIAYLDKNTPKLLDFGLAQMLREHRERRVSLSGESGTLLSSATTLPADSAAQNLVGTPQYMSPELIRDRRFSANIDLWALCLVLYESLSGVNPKSRETLRETLLSIVTEPMPDIRTYIADCPPPMASFFQDAFAPQISRRPASAPIIKGRLEEILETCSTSQIPAS